MDDHPPPQPPRAPLTARALRTHPLFLWSSLALKALETSTAAAEVIAIRSRRLARAGLAPGLADRREFARMHDEKVDAFSRAGHALATGALPLVAGMAHQGLRGALDVLQAATRVATARSLPQTLERQCELADTLIRHAPSPHAGVTAAARLAHRALEPVHATATGNARRLAGGGRRGRGRLPSP